jgi:D-arginine dehydrogenase
MTSADVLIVGAGIAGASLGFQLAGRCKVIILESESQPGYHATGRSAALFTTTYGQPIIRALTLASRSFFENPPPAFAATPLLKPRSVLWIAREDQQRRLDTFLGEAAILDPTVRACPLDEAVRLFPALERDYVAAAIIEPDACDIDVHTLHRGYLRAFKARGGEVINGAHVREIRSLGTSWQVAARGKTYSCGIAVNAAGAWADEIATLAGAIPVGLIAKRRTAITFDPPPGVDIDDWCCVLDFDEEFYIKPDAGRLLASPADETPVAPYDAQPEEWDVALAVDRIERGTTLRIGRIAAKWAGLRTFATDKLPIVGRDVRQPGFFWLAGQGGYGIMTSPALAEIAAAIVLGESIPKRITELGIDSRSLAPERLQGVRPGA